MILNAIYKYSNNKYKNLSNLLYKSCKNYSLSNKKYTNLILCNENNKFNDKQKIRNNNIINGNNVFKKNFNNNLKFKKIEMHESHSPTPYLIKN
jgi:hypothetical protein